MRNTFWGISDAAARLNFVITYARVTNDVIQSLKSGRSRRPHGINFCCRINKRILILGGKNWAEGMNGWCCCCKSKVSACCLFYLTVKSRFLGVFYWGGEAGLKRNFAEEGLEIAVLCFD